MTDQPAVLRNAPVVAPIGRNPLDSRQPIILALRRSTAPSASVGARQAQRTATSPRTEGPMRKYRATVQVTGIAGESPRAVRSALDEQLRQIGLQNCEVVSIDLDAPTPVVRRPAANGIVASAPPAQAQHLGAGRMLLAAAAAWALLFFWWV